MLVRRVEIPFGNFGVFKLVRYRGNEKYVSIFAAAEHQVSPAR